jgi:DNA-binding NarL/FixJ family response regulator
VSAQRDAMAKAVFVVDDNPKVREALCRLFTLEAPFEVCGEAKNGREAIEKAEELQPDLMVMDLSMPGLNGLDAARAIKRLMPNLPIIMFSDYVDAFLADEARIAGIAALVSKSEDTSVLVDKARSLFPRDAA